MKPFGGPLGFPLVVNAPCGPLNVVPRAISVVVHGMLIPVRLSHQSCLSGLGKHRELAGVMIEVGDHKCSP